MSGAVEGVDIGATLAAADYLISLYERLWKGGAVRDLAEAIGTYDRLKLASLTAPPARTYAEGETETQWEVWEDDLMVASSTDEVDALHYLAVYSQDGPVRLVKAVTVRTPCEPLATSHSQHEGAGTDV